MNEVKVGKASHTCNFISKLLQGGKNIVAFCSTVRRLSLIVLCWKTLGRFQNRICIVSIIISSDQERESKILYIAMKRWELQLTLHFYRFCSEGYDIWMPLTRICMAFNFMSLQVIESQMCLWICKIFSTNLSKTLQ